MSFCSGCVSRRARRLDDACGMMCRVRFRNKWVDLAVLLALLAAGSIAAVVLDGWQWNMSVSVLAVVGLWAATRRRAWVKPHRQE